MKKSKPPQVAPVATSSRPGRDGPIAIIGIGCRFPRAAGVHQLWHLLRQGGDAIQQVPPERFDVDRLYDPTPGVPGRTSTRWGGFLDRVAELDAGYFGIAHREATRMDPMQRVLLEVAAEALDDGGQVPERLAGRSTAVYVGACFEDYNALRHQYPEEFDVYTITGTGRNSLAGRLSFAFGLEGPSLSVDAACSSSLVAVHLACQSLRTGESEVALAGGVNLILHPAETIGFSSSGMLAPDGRCKAFDARADGFVRSDGAGVVILKPLSRALADEDPVYAVIRGTAVNNDGRTSGLLMTPSVEGQKGLMRAALRSAGVEPADVQYVEAHGTGTRVGDPVEARALGAVLGGEQREEPLRLGSVKSNFGHTEGAAGVAGLIKTALCLHHRTLVPSLHCETPNPEIEWDALGLTVQRELEPWPEPEGRPRLAGVSSFGISGTNAHAVLEAAPPLPSRPPEGGRPHLLCLSADSAAALTTTAERWAEFLRSSDDGARLDDLVYTASARRTRHHHRLAVAGGDRQALAEGLDAFVAGETRPGLVAGTASEELPRVAFVFPGQGSQWLGMGRELYASEPVFRRLVDRCEEAFAPFVDWSLREQLHADEEHSRLDEVDVVQPLLFAMQVALAELWSAWGVKPDVVVGQSMGEVAAAHVSGALSLEDAARVICLRSRIVRHNSSGSGGMAVVELPLEAAEAAVAEWPGLGVAVNSSPSSTVISGDVDELESLVEELTGRDVFCRLIQVDYASHSPQMDPLRPLLMEALGEISSGAPALPMISTVTREAVTEGELDGDYWVRNLREPVLFSSTIGRLVEDGVRAFVEVSPHPVVNNALQDAIRHSGVDARVLGSLRRQEPERETLLGAVGVLDVLGRRPAWERLYPHAHAVPGLPSYPWQGDRFPLNRLDSTDSPAWSPSPAGGPAASPHPLLGWHLRSAAAADSHYWEMELGARTVPFLADHRVQGTVVLPAAAYLEMALAAAAEAHGPEARRLEGVRFDEALVLPEDGSLPVQMVMAPEAPGTASFRIFGTGEEGGSDWAAHARGRVRLRPPRPEQAEAPQDLQRRLTRAGDGEDHDGRMAARGLEYGPAFRSVREWWQGEGEALARLELPEGLGSQGFVLPPSLLDGAFQVVAASLFSLGEEAGEETSGPWLPVALEELTVAPGAVPTLLWAYARVDDFHGREGRGEVRLLDDEGRVLASARGLELRRLGGEAEAEGDLDDLFHAVEWQIQECPEESPSSMGSPARGTWLLLVRDEVDELGHELGRRLSEQGGEAILVRPGEEGLQQLDPGAFRVDPGDAAAFRELFQKLAAEDRVPRGVVHLWGAGAAKTEELDPRRLTFEQDLGTVAVIHLLQGLTAASLDRAPRLFLVTAGSQAVIDGEEVPGIAAAPLWGLGRVIAYEHPELRCTRIDLPGVGPDVAADLAVELVTDLREDQVALRDHGRRVARLVRRPPREAPVLEDPQPAADRPYRLELGRPGILDELALVEAPRREPAPGEVEVEVAAAGLNFIDVMRALGIYPGQPDGAVPLGAELAGRVSAVGPGVEGVAVGDEVMGISHSSRTCFASHALTDARLVMPRPEGLSFEGAATVPTAFLTAAYALEELGRLRSGETVLVHSASGGVGLAALQVARARGATVFGTAGSEEKRGYLRSLGLPLVMDSRSLDFAEEVMEATGGRGVDVVLNSLTGEAIARGLAILAPYGRFLELGKRDIYGGGQIDLSPFRKNLSYSAIDVDRMILERPEVLAEVLQRVADGFRSGDFQPLPSRVYPMSDCGDGFRFMAQARHVGKIVFATGDGEIPIARHRGRPVADRTYLVTGGLGALGLEVAGWLVSQGARHLALLGRSAPSSEAERRITGLEERGARVQVVTADVSDLPRLTEAVERVEADGPPLGGVFHAAGLLDDGILVQLDREQVRRVNAPKVQGAWNLHRLTADRDLRHFVLFSSAAGLLGSPGQGSYAAANELLDALAHHRRARGLPALSIDWGPWDEVGLAAARADRGERLARRGLGGMAPQQALAALGRLMASGETRCGVMPFSAQGWCRFQPVAAGHPFFELLAGEPPSAAADGQEGEGLTVETLARVSDEERRELLTTFLCDRLARVLGLPRDQVDPHRPIHRLGVDSLMAVELRNRVEADLGLSVSVVSLLKGPTPAELAGSLGEQVETVEPDSVETDPSPTSGSVDELSSEEALARLEEMSAEELDRMMERLEEGSVR